MPGNRWKGVDKALLQELHGQGLRASEIAPIMGLGASTVNANLKKMGLSHAKGGRVEVYQARARSCGSLPPEFREYLDGLLMSDGSLRPITSAGISSYSQTCVERDWLERIKDEFGKMGIQGTVSPERRVKEKPGRPAFVFRTLAYRELGEQRTRWYPGGSKTLPGDLNFNSPKLWNNFVCGDGHFSGNTHLELGLDKYGKEKTLWVRDQLRALGYQFEEFSVGLSASGSEKWRLQIGVLTGVDEFFDFIGPPPVEAFRYKWPTPGTVRQPWKSHKT